MLPLFCNFPSVFFFNYIRKTVGELIKKITPSQYLPTRYPFLQIISHDRDDRSCNYYSGRQRVHTDTQIYKIIMKPINSLFRFESKKIKIRDVFTVH